MKNIYFKWQTLSILYHWTSLSSLQTYFFFLIAGVWVVYLLLLVCLPKLKLVKALMFFHLYGASCLCIVVRYYKHKYNYKVIKKKLAVISLSSPSSFSPSFPPSFLLPCLPLSFMLFLSLFLPLVGSVFSRKYEEADIMRKWGGFSRNKTVDISLTTDAFEICPSTQNKWLYRATTISLIIFTFYF